ncbi:MAG: hypothetical protein P8Y73_12680 [Desulfuromonadales bacterium]
MRLLLLLILFCPTFSFAGQNQYVCEIFGEYHVNENGMFTAIDSPLVGQSFTVDRDSGSVTGKPFATDQSGMEQTLVQKGDSSGRFKLVSTYANPHKVQILTIDEAVNGKVKPFWGTDSHFIFTGLCE